MKQLSIAIVGAGIVGATAAYQLSKTHHSVTIFDDGVGQATSAAAGIICPWLSQRRNQEWYQLVKHGANYYPNLMEQLKQDGITELPYKQVGTLVFKKEKHQLEKLLQLAIKRREDAPMIGELKLLSPEEIATIIPGWIGTQSALFASGGGRVDGKQLTNQLVTLAIKNNATLHHEKVTLLSSTTLQTANGTQHFDKIIMATGAWTKENLQSLHLDIDIRPQKGQLIELDVPEPYTQKTATFPVCMLHGEIDLIPFDNGKLLIGATHENDMGFDLTASTTLQQQMLEEACTQVEWLQPTTPFTHRVGTRAYTSDFSVFFGFVPENEHVLVASGLGSSGLTSGAWIGSLLAKLCINEVLPIDITPYSPSRYIGAK